MSNLIDDIKNGYVEIVFAYDLSRISRDLFDSNIFFKLIDKYNVTLKCLYEDVKIKTASDRFTTNIKVLNNQYERERVIERTNDALRQIAKGGRYPCGGPVLFGYVRGEDKNLYVDSISSKIVIRAIEMGKQCESIHDIINFLNESQNTICFTTDRVRSLFSDIRYAGIFEYKGETYTNIIPAITTLDDLEAASKNYKKVKYKNNEKYYFDGLVYCSLCGTRMSCTHSYGRKNIYYYYNCKKCQSTIGQLQIERYLNSRALPNTKKEKMESKLKKERIKLTNRIKRYREKLLNEVISDREFCSLIIPLEDRLEKVKIMLKGLRNKESLCYNVNAVEKDKKAFAMSNIKMIKVNPVDKIVVEVKTI